MNKRLIVKNVTKVFNEQNIISNLNLDLTDFQVKTILGPSGSGKTTLLRVIAGLEKSDSGSIQRNGTFGIVFQDFNIWSHRTVLNNIIDALIVVKKMDPDIAKKIGINLLGQFDLLSKKDVYPDFLSGGQKQRLTIARTLAMDPDIILFDEITSSLDIENIQNLVDIIGKLKSEGKAILVVTHEIGFAKSISDEIMFMDHGEILESGKPADILNFPKNERLKKFLNLF